MTWLLLIALTGVATLLVTHAFFRVRDDFVEHAEAVLSDVAPSTDTRWVVTGQIGAGKSTLARAIASQGKLTHVQIDEVNSETAQREAIEAAARGWVAEACPWQISADTYLRAQAIVYLDYPTLVFYCRILRRCAKACLAASGWPQIREQIAGEGLHLKIMYLYAAENRAGFEVNGLSSGRADTQRIPHLRLRSPREADLMLDLLSRHQS